MAQSTNPSNQVPLSSQHDDNTQKRKNRPDLKDLKPHLQENILDQFDFSNRVLLSPPPFPDNFNHPETVTSYDGSSIGASHLQYAHDSSQLPFRKNDRGDMLFPLAHQTRTGGQQHSVLSDLQIRTDIPLPQNTHTSRSGSSESLLRQSASASSLPRQIPSVRATLHSTAGSLSPGLSLSSPQIGAMLDITPLPSPVGGGSESFKLLSRSRSRGSSVGSNSAQIFPAGTIPTSSPPRRKAYHGLRPTPENTTLQQPSSDVDTRSRETNRSTSEYVPESIAVSKPRNIAVSGGSGTPADNGNSQTKMQREEFLGIQRGLVSPIVRPPSTPVFDGGCAEHDDIEEPAPKRARTEVYTVRSTKDGLPRKYKSIRELGQGTFSTVYLAVREVDSGDDRIDYRKNSDTFAGVKLRSKRLVAVKVVQHGPAGGADAERIQVSLQREVEIMKMVQHPSLVHLKAFGAGDDSRALLVMNYCPGGDLFEVASTNVDVLTPRLVRRIFSELVSATRYLHQKYIVHRDIKLENVLLNIPVTVHPDVPDWQTLDRAVVTLTDLGLSRRIPEPPESPLLTTRCGSEDYAAPELLMGQQYDGRQTDAWALGVLLYALMEGRLPFDPLPGTRGDPIKLRARTPHRIARCEWAWYKYGDEDGDWDPDVGGEFEDAFLCVDGLLKRNTRRKNLNEIRELPWVQGGIDVDGGLRWVEEEAL